MSTLDTTDVSAQPSVPHLFSILLQGSKKNLEGGDAPAVLNLHSTRTEKIVSSCHRPGMCNAVVMSLATWRRGGAKPLAFPSMCFVVVEPSEIVEANHLLKDCGPTVLRQGSLVCALQNAAFLSHVDKVYVAGRPNCPLVVGARALSKGREHGFVLQYVFGPHIPGYTDTITDGGLCIWTAPKPSSAATDTDETPCPARWSACTWKFEGAHATMESWMPDACIGYSLPTDVTVEQQWRVQALRLLASLLTTGNSQVRDCVAHAGVVVRLQRHTDLDVGESGVPEVSVAPLAPVAPVAPVSTTTEATECTEFPNLGFLCKNFFTMLDFWEFTKELQKLECVKEFPQQSITVLAYLVKLRLSDFGRALECLHNNDPLFS
jgi:hypothetical protein